MIEALTTPHPAKLSVEDFILLDGVGAFGEYSKTELIDGTIYVVNAQYSEHLKAKVRLLRRLADACDDLGTGLEAWSEGSISLGQLSMPEPDVFVTMATPITGPVRKETVVLVVEVADTTQSFDLGEKLVAYAQGGIGEYWVVDLKERLIQRMWSPAGGSFQSLDKIVLGERIESATIAGLGVETEGLS